MPGFVAPMIAFIILAFVCYQAFVSDWVEEKKIERKEIQTKIDSLSKIAQIKLVSDESKDIEKFITDNAEYLSVELVEQLVGRIEAIKVDHIIDGDSLLKSRIDNLDKHRNEALEILDVEPVVLKKASRKK